MKQSQINVLTGKMIEPVDMNACEIKVDGNADDWK
jgi:hypothetical protein